MKKIVTIIILAATWYFAGMNQQPSVMAAAVCGLVFVIFSFLLARILKHFLSADIPPQKNIIYKNTEAELTVHVENKSRLPVNRYKINILMKYRGEKKGTQKKFNGNASGGKDSKDNTAVIYFTAPYSGIIDVSMTKLRVYDYFMIFSSSKRLKNISGEVIVLPPPRKMHIRMPAFGSYTNEPVAESSSDTKGEDHSEIRLIREYREGDLTRHMHRNYSARTEKIWIKEYQKENDYIFDMFIDTSYSSELMTDDKDAFYEMVNSVLYNLMEHDIIILIHYFDKNKGGLIMYELSDKSHIDDFTAVFFRADTFCTKEEYASVSRTDVMSEAMFLTTSLEWFFNGKHIFTFKKGKILQELEQQFFDLV